MTNIGYLKKKMEKAFANGKQVRVEIATAPANFLNSVWSDEKQGKILIEASGSVLMISKINKN